MLGFYPLGAAPLADDGVSTGGVDVLVFVTGVFATGAVGYVLIWGNIVPDQNPGFAQVIPGQVPDWVQIVPTSAPAWT